MAKLYFSHYFTPFPLSLSQVSQPGDGYDTAYLAPGGEHGIHAAYGGFIRDRPVFRGQPLRADWQQADFEYEVRQAIAGGLDGWTMDLLSTERTNHWVRQEQVLNAAHAVDPNFKIMLMPDMGPMQNMPDRSTGTQVGFADRIAALAKYPAAFRLDDGRLVISPFHAELWNAARWKTAFAACSALGVEIAFVPCFLNYDAVGSMMSLPQMYGASTWGDRSPAAQPTTNGHGVDAHNRGLIWMHPVSVQDERPRSVTYDEACNTQNLRDTWAGAISTNAEWVQVPTWNDYSEGAQLAPTEYHGWAYLNLSNYYMRWWKTGSAPAPTKDELYLTHRRQPYNATPTGGQTQLMHLRANSSAPRDTVEVVSILTSPGTITINVGSHTYTQSRPAGLSVGTTVPLDVGTVTASLSRPGEPPLNVTTPTPVSAQLVSQDLQYIAATAVRSATTVPRILGINDAVKPTGFLDTLEGAYSGGSGSGISNRVPGAYVTATAWTDITTSLSSGSRSKALFDAGHEMLLSFPAPATFAAITNGSNDAAIDAFGDRLYALNFGAAVSGTQPGVGYGGTKAAQIRICFSPNPEGNTAAGTSTDFKAAWRHFCGRIKARKPAGAVERARFVCGFSYGAQGNGQAALYYPGGTATDYVDEIGVNGVFSTTPSFPSFSTLMAPWYTWAASNASNRKITVMHVAPYKNPADAAYQSKWIVDVANTLLAETRLAAVFYYEPDTYSTTPDDRALFKSFNLDAWQGFHDAVAIVVGAGSPPVDVTPPATPTGLSAPTLTATSVTLTWNQPPDPDVAGYQLMRDSVVVASPSGAGSTSYTVSGQAPETTHAYQVAAFDTAATPNVSAFSAPLSVTHPAVAAYNPPSITAAAVTMVGTVASATATATDPAGGTVVIVWTWGDGDSSTDSPQSHTYAAAGDYAITVTATSTVSGLSSSQTINVTASNDANTVTPYLGLAQPITGQPVGAFGPSLRANNNRLDQVIQKIDQRKVQNGTGTPFASAPIVSYTGTVSAAFEAPSDDYPDGRIIITGA